MSRRYCYCVPLGKLDYATLQQSLRRSLYLMILKYVNDGLEMYLSIHHKLETLDLMQ